MLACMIAAQRLQEASIMACIIKKRDKVALSPTVNPTYRDVIRTYVQARGFSIETAKLDSTVSSDSACLVVQHPNFLGHLEEIETYVHKAHDSGALLIAIVDPISLGMLKPPGQYGADIAVADGQALGNPMSFGGPGLGIFACRREYVRQMPGSIVGKTVDVDGKTGYVMTLVTREQYIGRERATSNICTSEALMALAAAVYLAALGKTGLRHVAELCYHKAHYAAERIGQTQGIFPRILKAFLQGICRSLSGSATPDQPGPVGRRHNRWPGYKPHNR